MICLRDLKTLWDRAAVFLKNKYVVIGICGLAILLLLLPWGSGKTEKESVLTQTPDEFDLEACEERLEDILSEIKGVRKARVFLSVESGKETVYAVDVDETVSEDRTVVKRETVISGGEGVRVKVLQPKFSGAVVVYSGTESASLRLNLTSAVSSATGLSTDKITVLCGG